MSGATPKPESEKFSPRNFLRARRPERFSDSVPFERPLLDRTTLEYHLDTLTSRSQETLFEEFARQLAQREVCPNLQSHTGPTGGGDSKVDSETYPVAEAISAGWYVGAGGSAGSQRWAFAISAKKDWRPKVRSDIASIVGTGRNYVKAFFISNQFIKDKQRAAEEDALSKAHGIDVRIFDRTWILDRVFGGGHEKLAITALSMSVPFLSEVRRGPLDTQRERDLEEVEQRIRDGLQETPRFGVVDACLEAALLARNLERPRIEIDGRFVRAQRIAVDHGTRHQQVQAFYQQAWTAFWWYEDFPEFERLYGEVERLALGSENVNDAELLSNLWTLLATAVRHRNLAADEAKLTGRTDALEQTLRELVAQEGRPSVGLQARALLATMALVKSFAEGHQDQPFQELDAVVRDAEGLVGFPLLRLSEFMTELSEFFVGNKAFEQLFANLVEATSKRRGEVSGAKMLLKLGAEQLDADRPYEAIRTLGRAFHRLYKHESRRAMVRALALCASAYERVGLLWAARGTLLNAASIATNEWWAHSEITLAQHGCFNRLKWVELQLGRVPHILAWHQIDVATRHLLKAEGYSDERLSLGESDFDGILGILLLRCDVWQLRQLEYLPDSLHRMDLDIAGLSLVFALGHTDEAGPDVSAPDQEALMRQLAAQPAAAELPPAPLLLSERTHTFRSTVLGCVIEATTDSQSPCIELAESILAATESLLATSVFEGVFPRVESVSIRVKHSDFADFPFTSKWTEVKGLPAVEVRCASFPASGLSLQQQHDLKDAIGELIAHVLGHAFVIQGEATLERMFRDELGLSRALNFTGSFGVIANTLGKSPRLSIQDWTADTQTRFNSRRRTEWDADDRAKARESAKAAVRLSDIPMGTGPIPEELDVSRVKHSEISFESLIRESLWNKAQWCAIGWASAEGVPPWMVLGFKNAQPAAEILTQLMHDIGNRDPENRLRITIVRNISRKNPSHYRVVIGSNIAPKDLNKVGAIMSRIHTMTPDSTENLDRFLASYNTEGSYLLGIGVIDPRIPRMPEPMPHGYVLKKTLNVREAWTIGLNDIDSPGVRPEDDIPIPPDRTKDAPALELLEWRSKRSQLAEWPSINKSTIRERGGRLKADGKRKRRKKGERQRNR